MVKWTWPRVSLGSDIVGALANRIEAIGEILTGVPRPEARIRRMSSADSRNWPPLGRGGFALGSAQRSESFVSGFAPAHLSSEAQRRFEKLERELKEARAASRSRSAAEAARFSRAADELDEQ
jgi:hypothetical protein